MKSYAKEAIFHEPNSRFAHAISDTQIQVRLQTKKMT
jgi:Alpha amylase, N-terminal ig-like domain.